MEFIWNPDFGAEKQNRPSVSNIKFGDGYEQRASFGINTLPQVWSLSFTNREEAEANAIDSFLKARGGTEFFTWITPDDGTELKFVCQEWTKRIERANRYSINATFRQVFDL